MNSLFLPILAQLQHIVVINKPCGVSVHNDPQDVRSLLSQQLPKGSFEDIYPVHRLDKETSGLLLIATEKKMATQLAEQFQKDLVEKNYLALLRGHLEPSETWQEWNFPITDKAEGRKNPQGVSHERVKAQSRYRVLHSNPYFSLADVKLITGRQHQIRKHAAIFKHPILGDPRYNDPKHNEKMAAIYKTRRMFLHACRMKIRIKDQVHTFETPIPEEFQTIFLPEILNLKL